MQLSFLLKANKNFTRKKVLKTSRRDVLLVEQQKSSKEEIEAVTEEETKALAAEIGGN